MILLTLFIILLCMIFSKSVMSPITEKCVVSMRVWLKTKMKIKSSLTKVESVHSRWSFNRYVILDEWDTVEVGRRTALLRESRQRTSIHFHPWTGNTGRLNLLGIQRSS